MHGVGQLSTKVPAPGQTRIDPPQNRCEDTIVNELRAFYWPEVRVPKKNPGEQHLASHSAHGDSHSYNIQATTNGAKMTATMVISLIRMFKLGPEVSLKGSPTVSPMTAAL